MYDFREIDKEINSIVNYVNNKYPSSNVYLVGYSFGASMAMKYVALNPN
jgi:alpha/beta superfamily hydrolase